MVIHCVLIAMVFLTVIPFYYMVVVSFAPYQDVAGGAFYLIPRHIDFASYALIFEDTAIPRAFLVSTLVTIVGTGVSMLVTTSAAYALSKKGLPIWRAQPGTLRRRARRCPVFPVRDFAASIAEMARSG